VPAPSWEGTPIDAVVKQRGVKNKAIDQKEGTGMFPPTESLKGLPMVKATTHLQTKEDGEGGQGYGQSKSKKGTKKSSRKGLDDKTLPRSKRTKSDDKGSALGEERPDGAVVNLEAMKGSLRKKGSSTATPKGPKKKEKRKATFAEAASKGASRKPEPAVKYNKCVVAFAIRVDKGKDTKAGFNKKIVTALSFLQTYIDKHAAFFAISGLDSSRPPIKEKADLPAFQVILRRYFEIPSKWAFNSVNQDGGRAIKGSAVM
jgi:hypothetical protein